MAYTLPSYIVAAEVDSPHLEYSWDEWRRSLDYQYDSGPIVELIAPATLRAKIALAIGIFEWVVGRFRAVSDDPTPRQVAEAAWCANVDLRYMNYFELPRRAWKGPVRAPLWGAMTFLAPMIFFTDDDPEEWRPALLYLPPLAMHVLPKPEQFEAWMFACAERLVSLYPAPADDPFDDLFGERCHERRGPLVAREALDPQYDYRPKAAERLIDDFLRSVDFINNFFLNSPLQMREDGFEGAPYAR